MDLFGQDLYRFFLMVFRLLFGKHNGSLSLSGKYDIMYFFNHLLSDKMGIVLLFLAFIGIHWILDCLLAAQWMVLSLYGIPNMLK